MRRRHFDQTLLKDVQELIYRPKLHQYITATLRSVQQSDRMYVISVTDLNQFQNYPSRNEHPSDGGQAEKFSQEHEVRIG